MVEMRNNTVKRGIGMSAAGLRDTSPVRQPNGWDGPEVSPNALPVAGIAGSFALKLQQG